MKKTIAALIWLVGLLSIPAGLLAQDSTCSTLIQQTLSATEASCEQTGRNQACYGHILLAAQAQTSISDLQFDTPGDIDDLVKIQSLKLSPMDVASGEWGVALMRVQANLPDTMPGQNVTLLLFGDVEIREAPPETPPVLLNITPTTNVNVRYGASTNSAIVGALSSGQTITADGRNEAGDWLRIQLDTSHVGWVYAPLVVVDGDTALLPIRDATDTTLVPSTPQYRPYQAFYFRSGIGDAPCMEAPESGILIQTPEGAGKINLLINAVNVELG